MNQNRLLSLVSASAGAMLAATAMVISLPANAQELVSVKAGHLVAIDMAPLFVAKESGCFQKEGLDVETVFFANPGDNNAALAGGAIDFSTNPFTLPFFAANSGVPIKVIAAAGGWGAMEVIAQKETGLGSIGDIAAYVASGKPTLKIATLQGDTLELILTDAFAAEGVDPASVEFVYFNDLLAMVESFKAGQVNILSHIKPYTSQMIADKDATLLTTNAATWDTMSPNTVVSVLEKTLSDRPEVVSGYLNGLICAAQIINDTPEEAVALLTDGNYFRVTSDVLLASLKSAPAPVSFVPNVDSVQAVVGSLAALGYISGSVKASDIFALDLIESLQQ